MAIEFYTRAVDWVLWFDAISLPPIRAIELALMLGIIGMCLGITSLVHSNRRGELW